MGERSVSKGIGRELCDQFVSDILDANLEYFKENNPLEYDDLKINDYIGKIQNGIHYLKNLEVECQASISLILSFFSYGPHTENLLNRYCWKGSSYESIYHTVYIDKCPKLLNELERIWGLVFDGNRFYLLDRKGITLP